MRFGRPEVVLLAMGAPAGDPRETPVAFLANGRSTKEDVARRLGLPAMTGAKGRVLGYRVSRVFQPEGKDYVVVGPAAEGGDCSLLLVFDDRQILVKHSLTRAP